MQNKKKKYLRQQLVILNRNTIKITFLVSWIGSEKYLYVEGERCNVDIMYIHKFYVYALSHVVLQERSCSASTNTLQAMII